MTIRKRTKGWQVIVYAGLDPLTGKQRQITRQVNGSHRQAEKAELCETVIKHVHNEAKLYPGRARRGRN